MRSFVAMLKGKVGKADLTISTRFHVKYLGCGVTQESGVVGIENAVRKIQEKVENEKQYCPKMFLMISANGVKLEEVKTKSSSKESKLISLENISYCALNRANATIFAFNHQKSSTMVECHAVACVSEEKAKAISQALYAAFREGHFQKLRSERRKSLEQKNFQRKVSLENNECARSTGFSPATSPTQVFSPEFGYEFRDQSVTTSVNSTARDRHSLKHEGLLPTASETDDQEYELEEIIEELMSIVEIEKAKIAQESE